MKKILLFCIIIIVINVIYTNPILGQPNITPPILNSKSAIVIDAKTGTVIYEKNSLTKMYPASLTKIATAIYAIEKGNMDETVVISKNARNTGGSKVYLEKDEQVTLKKLVQGLLINSGNDAAVAIAEHLSGSIDQFSTDLNKYLTDIIGENDTHFENPHGLFNPSHVTTAVDLAKITQYAINNKLFREIFSTKELKWDGQSWDTTLITHHKLMREIPYEGITGGKTGYINQSGFTLATTAERKDLSLIVITLDSNLKTEVYKDTIKLLDYAFENYQTSSIPKGTTFKFNKQVYKTTSKLYYTHSLDDKINKKVNNDGVLEIINQDGKPISSFRLARVKNKDNKIKNDGQIIKKDIKKNTKKESKYSSLEKLFTDNSIYILFVLLGLFLLRQIRKTFYT